MSVKETLQRISRSVLLPLATTFTGVGGLAFHAGHGPEHLLCLVLAALMAVSGSFWTVYNQLCRQPEISPTPETPEPAEQGRYTMHVAAPGVHNYREASKK